jgi:hypothetical protein
MEKDLEKSGLKTDYEEGKLQPTPAGHPQLATPRSNYFLLVTNEEKYMYFQWEEEEH